MANAWMMHGDNRAPCVASLIREAGRVRDN
eukprot:SAG25_NODE_2844_length_1355_cov_1.544586_1_plen_29_part_01